MPRSWLTRGAFVLALAVGCWTTARGSDEAPAKSSWSAKLWPWSSAKKVPEGQKDANGQPAGQSKTDHDAVRRLQAETTWMRRADVCQKLRQIAYETKDEELERFVDRLDQRAWDTYYKQTQSGVAPLERIGIDFDSIAPSTKSAPAAAASKTREVQP